MADDKCDFDYRIFDSMTKRSRYALLCRMIGNPSWTNKWLSHCDFSDDESSGDESDSETERLMMTTEDKHLCSLENAFITLEAVSKPIEQTNFTAELRDCAIQQEQEELNEAMRNTRTYFERSKRLDEFDQLLEKRHKDGTSLSKHAMNHEDIEDYLNGYRNGEY